MLMRKLKSLLQKLPSLHYLPFFDSLVCAYQQRHKVKFAKRNREEIKNDEERTMHCIIMTSFTLYSPLFFTTTLTATAQLLSLSSRRHSLAFFH